MNCIFCGKEIKASNDKKKSRYNAEYMHEVSAACLYANDSDVKFLDSSGNYLIAAPSHNLGKWSSNVKEIDTNFKVEKRNNQWDGTKPIPSAIGLDSNAMREMLGLEAKSEVDLYLLSPVERKKYLTK